MKRDLDFEIQFYESVYKRNPSDVTILEVLANLYTRAGRTDEGLRLDRRHVRLQPHNPTAHYNLACSLAIKQRRPDAVRALRSAIQLGFRDFNWMLEDPDLRNIHDYHRFHKLLAEFEIQT